jgi:filamentous hemagglutinin
MTRKKVSHPAQSEISPRTFRLLPGRSGALRRGLSTFLLAALTTSALSPALGQSAPVATSLVRPADTRTTLDVTPGGTPIVNIAAPDANGASHNIYTSLSVGEEGLIFNNSPEVGQSTIGGFLLANPNLQRSGSASLILNEVTGGVRTTLAGPMEIFGARAALVIANPTGITCDGCGFINMSRVTLASGRLVFGADGAFAGLAVDGGDVSVEGKGLLAGNVDYFDIVAGAAHINASLYARDLLVAGGQANIDYAQRVASARGSGSGGIAIDSTLLGGMYANRIRLIGTGDGVGVNMGGLVAALDGPLAITADANIGLGKIAASGDVTVSTARGSLVLADQLYSGGAVSLAAAGQISQDAGFIGAASDVALAAGSSITTGGSGVYAGLGSDGSLNGAGSLRLTAGSSIDTQGATLAAGGIDIAAAGAMTVSGVIASSGDARLTGDSVAIAGALSADGRLLLSGRDIIIDGSATGLASARAEAANRLAIGSGGALQSNGAVDVAASRLANDGIILGGAGIDLVTGSLANSGAILSGSDLVLVNEGNAALGGTIEANGAGLLTVGGDAAITGRIAVARDLTLDAAYIGNMGNMVAGGDLALGGSAAIDQAGVAEASGTLSMTGAGILLSGRSIGGHGVTIDSNDIAFAASSDLQSGGNLSIASATNLATGGRIAVLGAIDLSAAANLDQGAAIASNDAVTLVAGQDLSQTGSIDALGNIRLAGERIANSGAITSNADLALDAGATLSSTGGLGAVGKIGLTAPTVSLAGTITSNGLLTLTATDLTIDGTASGIAGIDARVSNLTITESGALQSGTGLDLSLARLDNQGLLYAAGPARIASMGGFTNAGEIVSGSSLALVAGAQFSSTGLVQASGDLSIEAADAIQLAGIVYSGANANIDAASLDASGAIAATGTLAIAVDGSAGFSDLSTSYAGGALTLIAADIETSGVLQSDAALAMTATGNLTLGGQIESKGESRLEAGNSASLTGTLASQGAFALNAANVDISGVITGQSDVAVTAGAGDISLPGTIGAVGDVRLTALRALTIGTAPGEAGPGTGGSGSGGTGTPGDTGGMGSNPGDTGGPADPDGETGVPAFVAENPDAPESGPLFILGSLSAAGDALLEADEIRIYGLVASQGDMSLLANHLLKIGGSAWSQSDLSASVENLVIGAAGTLGADGAATITAVQGIDNAGSLASNGGDLSVANGGDFTNSGTIFAGGTYRAQSAGDYTATGLVQAGIVSIEARDVTLGGVLAATNSLGVTGRNLTISLGGEIESAGTLFLTAAETLAADGRLIANGDAALTSGGSLALGNQADFSAGGVVALSADGQLATASGSRIASGEALNLSGAAITIDGEAISNGTLTADAVGGLVTSGIISAIGDLSLSANGLDLGGFIGTNSRLSLVDRGGTAIIRENALLRGDTIAIAAQGDLTNAGILAAVHGLKTDIGGSLVNAATGTLQAGTLDDNGNVTAMGSMRLAAGTEIDNQGLIVVTGSLDLASPRFANSGTLVSASDIDLSAPSLILGGTMISFGTVKVTSTAGYLEVRGGLEGQNITLDARGGDLLLGTDSRLVAYGGDALGLVNLSSTGDIAAFGTIAANNDVTVTAAELLHIGADRVLADGTLVQALTSQANVGLSAGSALVNDGTVQAGEALTLSATSLTSNNLLSGDSLDFRGSRDILLAGTTAAAGPIELVSSGGDLTLANGARVETVDAIRLSAAGDITNEGVILAGQSGTATPLGTIDLAAGGTLISSGAIISNNGDVNFRAASVTLGGSFGAGGGTWAAGRLAFDTSDLVLAAGGEAIAGSDLRFTGNTLTLNDGSLLQSNGNIAITLGGVNGTGSYSSAGQLVALGDLALSVEGALENKISGGIFAGGSGDDRPGGNITVDAASLDNGGTIFASAAADGAKGNVDIAAPTITTSGLIHADNAVALDAQSLTLNAPTGDGPGIVESGTALTLSIPTISIAEGASLRSGDAVTIATANFTNAGDLLAGGDIAVAASQNLVSTGTIATIGAVDLAAGNSLQLSGLTSAGTRLDLEGGDIALAGTIQAWNADNPQTNNVTVTATTGALAIDGALISGGDLALSTPALLSLSDNAALYVGGSVSGTADEIAIAATISGAPSIAARGDVDFASQSGLILNGTIVADGNVTLTDRTALTLGSTSLISAGVAEAVPSVSSSRVTLSGPVIAANGNIATTGTLGFQTSNLLIAGTAVANGDILLTAWNGRAAPTLDIAASGTLATYLGNADLGSLGGADVAGTLIASRGDVRFSTPGAFIAETGEIVAGRDLSIDIVDGEALGVDGTLIANRNISLGGGTLAVGETGAIRAGQDLIFNTVDARSGTGPISVNGTAYDLTGTPISAEIAGSLSAGRDLTLVMPGALIVQGGGEISAVNDIAVTAGHAIVGARYSADAAGNPTALGVIAGRDFTFTNAPMAATGNLGANGLNLDGSIQAGRNVTVNALGDASSTAASQFVAGDALSIAGSSLDLAGLNSGQTLVRLDAGGAVRLSGATASNGRIEIRGQSTLVTSTGSLSAFGGSGNQTAVGRDIGAAANIDIQTAGDIVNEGTIWSDGVIFLKSASGDIVNNAAGANGGITGLNAIVTRSDSGAFVNIAGAFNTANAGLYMGGDFVNAGTFARSGNYLISAANISNSGLLAASGNLTLEAAGNLTNTGTIFAGDDLAFRVGGTLTNGYEGDDQSNGNHGLILAANDISITARDVINESALIQSLGGDIDIGLTGGNLVNRIKTLVISEVPGTGAQYLVMDGPDEVSAIFAEVGCGGFGFLSNGNKATFTCSPPNKVRVKYSGGGAATYDFFYRTEYGQNDTVASSNSGTGTISAAGNLAISGGAGTITNSNSVMLAGGGINIATTGTANNIADLLIKNVSSGGTTTLTNQIIPGAPTIIRAGGTVGIQSGTFNNIANNLVEADSYSGNQVQHNSAPGGPASTAPGTGGAGTVAGGSTVQTGAAAGNTAQVPGGGANVASASGAGLSAPGTGDTGETGSGAIRTSSLTLEGPGPVAAARISVAGGADGSEAVAATAIDAAMSSGDPVAGLAPGSGRLDGTGLAGGDAEAIAGPMGADGAESAVLALGPGFAGTGLPALGGQDFGSFLDGFLQQFNLVGADGSFALAGGASLFTYNDNPDSAYLFTTNAALSSEAALYDSSYFFGKFSPDRATTYTRLGDGFFEAMLISREVQAATGQAQLGSFGSVLDQYQGLLNNAAEAQQGLGLQLGIGLTDAQVSELTAPILWYVTAKVAGRDVLVPVLYLSAADSKSIGTGALVAGENVLVNATGNITNSGTIDARNVAALAAGGNIVNASGGVVTGGSVIAQAAGDILLGGGSTIAANGTGNYLLPGGAVVPGGLVALTAGRDIISTAVTTTSTSMTGETNSPRDRSSTYSRAETVSGATINSAAGTTLSAGRDINLEAAQLASGGPTTIIAAGDVTLGGTTAASRTRETEQTGKYQLSSTVTDEKKFVGTTITSGGPITIGALEGTLSITGGSIATTNPLAGDISLYGGEGIDIASGQSKVTTSEFDRLAKRKTVATTTDSTINSLASIDAAGSLGIVTPGALNVAGATLTAADALTVDADSIAITGVIDSTDYTQDSLTKKKGLFSSKKTTTHVEGTDETVIASTLSGDTVSMNSVGDTSILGSNVVASNGVDITAGGDLLVGALAATDTESSTTKVKKSGISLSGNGLFAGVAKSRTENDVTSVTHTGSLIGSETGDVTLDAGKALTVSGSDVVGTGTTTLSGESVTIQNVTDTADTSSLTKTSSVGVSIGVQSSVVDGISAATRAGEIATGSSANDRTKAVAGLAGGLAVSNTIDAFERDPGALGGVSASISLGISKSKSTSETHDETVVASNIAGTDVNLIARGNGTPGSGTLDVIGSDVTAVRNLTVAATDTINFSSATETDTEAGKSKSSGASIGVSAQFGSGGMVDGTPSVNLSVSGSKSHYAGETVTHRESNLTAGGTASVTTPDTLTLEGAKVSAERVEVSAGALTIRSEQDTAISTSRETSGGLSASVNLSGQVSVSGNLSKGKQDGAFASVTEQSGIFAGTGGFGIKVDEHTQLDGGVISSEADASQNSLITGTLGATDIENRENYSASQMSIGAGIGANLSSRDGTSINTNQSGQALPGIATGIGTISGTLPVAASASGSQSGITQSAISPATIIITSGNAASEAVAATISRDPASANDGAIVLEFDEAKRREISEGFEATELLTGQTSLFLANRAADQKQKEEDAARQEKELAAGYRLGSDDKPLLDNNGQPIPLTTAERALYSAGVDTQGSIANLRQEAKQDGTFWGGGGTGNIILTALNGAASGNVTGSLTDLVRAASVNVLQSYATQIAKGLADGLKDGDLDFDGIKDATGASEAARTALQALVGCAGSAAGGSGDCGGAAMGASASVVLNLLLNVAGAPQDADTNGDGRIDDDERLALEDQQARTNLVATVVTAIAEAAGLDPAVVNTAAQIETQNNELKLITLPSGKTVTIATSDDPNGVLVEEQLSYEKGDPERAAIDTLISEYGLERFEEAPVALQKYLEFVLALQAKGRSDEIEGAIAFIDANFDDSVWLGMKVLGDIQGGMSSAEVLNRYIVQEAAIRALVPEDATPAELRKYTLTYMYGGMLGPVGIEDVLRTAKLDAAAKQGYVAYLSEMLTGLTPLEVAEAAVLFQAVNEAVDKHNATGVSELARTTEESAAIASRALIADSRALARITAGGRVTGDISMLSVGDAKYVGELIAAGKNVELIPAIGANGARTVEIVANGVPTGRVVALPVSSGGTANIATGPRLAEQISQQNLAAIASQDGRLALALRGSGTGNTNFGIGTADAAEANRLGHIFVGDGATMNAEGFWVSADRTRVYRPPSAKPNTPPVFNPTGVQANFVVQSINPISGKATVISNGHMVITP